MNKINADLLKSKIPISSVVNHLKIKRSGANYHCISPTHRDENASLSINEKENYFHCFGCGIGGSVVDLYMIQYGISFVEAVRQLAIDFNIAFYINKYSCQTSTQISTKNTVKHIKYKVGKSYNFLCKYDKYLFDERAGISESDLTALECIKMQRLERNKTIFRELYNYCHLSGLSDDVYSYLTDTRKLSDEVIRTSKFFSILNYSDTDKYLKSIFDIEELRGSGLYKDDNFIFRNTHRLLIPYLENDQIIYLRARFFDRKEHTHTSTLKYFGLRNDDLNLNTVKRFYNKDILPGLKIYDELFICEGELDCLSLLSIGLKAIAIPGVSALPLNELNSLTDYNITICFDNDLAGKLATEKLVEAFSYIGKKINIIELPEGIKDVSDFIIQRYSLKNKS